MKTLAKCMSFSPGEAFPYCEFGNDKDPSFYPCTNEVYECWQPEGIENSEYNLVIILHNFPVRVRGCHFDFV